MYGMSMYFIASITLLTVSNTVQQSTGPECYTLTSGADYRGNRSVTASGNQCQMWTSQSPHAHDRTPANYSYSGLGDHNYCRNPDGETGPWCYTTDPGIRWEYCDVGQPQTSCGINIRLVGVSANQGRVEIYFNGTWGSICDDSWDSNDAQVVCRQLGFSEVDHIFLPFGNAWFGQSAGPIWLDDVDCQGIEEDITACAHNGWRNHNCQHTEDAGVICQEIVRTDVQVRLAGGINMNQGRVEVYLSEESGWGTVCDDDWHDTDANIICRQLGFPEGDHRAVANAGFGEGTGPIWLDNVKCNGSESNIANCAHNGWGFNNCEHSEDAGVVCVPGVRLVGGSPIKGRVEVFIDGHWGSICDNDWDNNDTKVVCRQLGFFEGDHEAIENTEFGEGTGDILLDEVMCVGFENAITNCPYIYLRNNTCNHSQEASVMCEDLPNYRGDRRCGPEYPAPNGKEGVCLGTCCSQGGWCGPGEPHCTTALYKDYREKGPCKDGWIAFQGSCYYFSERSPRRYADAEQWCSTHGSTLTTVLNQIEHDFMNAFVFEDNLWIGLNDRQQEGLFQWPNGTILLPGTDFDNFAQGEPNNTASGDCVYMMYGGSLWTAVSCNNLADFSCKYELPNYRNDTRCGPSYPAPNLEEGICLGTCCSFTGWCDISKDHCETQLYKDFREIGPCLDGWVAYQGFCYYFSSDDPRTYADAEKWCIAHGSTLASIYSQKEQDFVAAFRTERHMWLGLNDRQKEGLFQWTDGSLFLLRSDFNNFASDQPENNDDEDCVYLIFEDSSWKITACDKMAEYACKRQTGKTKQQTSLLIPVLVPIATFMILLMVIGVCIYRKRKLNQLEKILEEVELEKLANLSTNTSLTDSITADKLGQEGITLFKEIGHGAFGIVYKAEFKEVIGTRKMSKFVAVKLLKAHSSETARTDFLTELHLYQTLEYHPNVISMINTSFNEDPMYLVLEFAPNGNLKTYLDNVRTGEFKGNNMEKRESISSTELLAYGLQISSGMAFLSGKGCVHRDLAARNILLGENMVCKLSDFGLARDLAGEQQYEMKSSGRVPIRWMSPESILHNLYTTKTDVWSFGILLWEVVTLGAHPYPGMSSKQVINAVKKGYRLPKPEHCSDEIFSIMSKCWNADQKIRPAFNELQSELENMLTSSEGYLEMSEFDEHNYVYMGDQDETVDVPDESSDGSNMDSVEMRYLPSPSRTPIEATTTM